jgi:molybdenum cofactor biosynthesis enzyme MoaA
MTEGALTLDHPYLIKVSLGSYCNHACTFCKKIQVDDDWKQDLSVFDYVLSHAEGVQELTVTGGEPLVFMKKAMPKIRQIAENSPNMRLIVMTNGALLGNMAETLSNFNSLKIQVSLNAANRQSYNRVHRVDDFDTVCDGIREMKRLKPDTNLGAKMVYMRPNVSDIKAYPCLAKSLGVDWVKFNNMTFFPNADASKEDAFKATDHDWPSVSDDLEAAAQECEDYGIYTTIRRPGQKRLDSLDDWDDDDD